MKVSILFFIFLQACISLPDVYVVDQATVLQEEAAGHWPELEKVFRKAALKKTPTALGKTLIRIKGLYTKY